MNELLMSICIPTYNRVNKLNELLNFILNEFEKYSDKIEILVSDNASTDGTNELLKGKKEKNCKFDYWKNNENLGSIGNLFKLMKKAKGEYIWFIGDDDILLPGIADEIFNVFKNNKIINGILLNHSAIYGKNENIIENSLVPIPEKFYIDGKKIILNIIKKGKYGVIMFITANIVKRSTVLDVVEQYGKKNLAIPLLWTMVNSKKNLYVIEKIYLYDQYSGTTWTDDAFFLCTESITDILCSLEKFGYSKDEVQTCLKARLNTENSLTLLLFKYFLKNPIKGISIYRKYGFINIILRTPKQFFEYLKRKLSKGK